MIKQPVLLVDVLEFTEPSTRTKGARILQPILHECQIASCLDPTPQIIWASFSYFSSTKVGNHIDKNKLCMIELQ